MEDSGNQRHVVTGAALLLDDGGQGYHLVAGQAELPSPRDHVRSDGVLELREHRPDDLFLGGQRAEMIGGGEQIAFQPVDFQGGEDGRIAHRRGEPRRRHQSCSFEQPADLPDREAFGNGDLVEDGPATNESVEHRPRRHRALEAVEAAMHLRIEPAKPGPEHQQARLGDDPFLAEFPGHGRKRVAAPDLDLRNR